jgi:prolyl-tRNA editing enzyme YbaK/EbsC (Cys-tRNA(Pro) deacylase)
MNTAGKVMKIKEFLFKSGIETTIKEFPQSTRTAQEAADVIGCTVGQIAKSLIFKSESGKPVLVIASGSNRVDTAKVEAAIQEKIGKADADFVLEKTGFIIGGVPPFDHSTPVIPIIDEDLTSYEEIWASAGTPHSVFKIKPEELIRITHGIVSEIRD